MIGLVGADRDAVQAWVGQPLPAILLVLLLIATFYHAALGLQVVIEDYVHGELRAGSALVIVTRLACVALAVAGIVAVLTGARSRGLADRGAARCQPPTDHRSHL